MEKRKLGKSELKVSVLGLGCWPLGGGPGWGDQDEKDSIATIHAALDLGINFFDTAEGYNEGRSEQVVGKALEDRRDKAIIATKISPSNASPAVLRQHCEASLRRLRTDYVDLYQVHWPVSDHSVEDAFRTLQDLQAEGKVREIGVSNHGLQQLTEALGTGTRIVSNQLCYNLLSRAIEAEIVPLCHEHQISVIAYMALMQGILIGKYETLDDIPSFRQRTRHFSGERPEVRHGEAGAEQETFAAIGRIRQIAQDLGLSMAHVAMAWVAAKPDIASLLVGSRSLQQITENVAAADVVLAEDVVDRLDRATETLRQALGNNADYWQGEANSRMR